MTPEQLIKYTILELVAVWSDLQISPTLSAEEVEELWDDLDDDMGAISEVRCSGVPTGLSADYSRHYESEAVAVQAPNGQWVGFTYWYGGGKFGDPDSIDWMEHAYHLDCVEEEKLVVVQTFSKKGEEIK